jgi:elongator complex protein 2
MWRRDNIAESDRWIQSLAATGHTQEVNGITWSRDGAYLLSTGNDQTTRLHAEWKTNGNLSWHEFSRPQIHGYDLNCIDTITNTQFISGADEKLLRVFDEPDGVADILSRLCGIEKPVNVALPDAANIPVLGLSNKAIETVADDETLVLNGEDRDAPDPASIVHKSTLKLDEPPLEDHLARHLLWPEREKLYGHGYEVNVVAASHDGTLVATACRASSVDHAVIRLYDTKEWREIKPVLKAHTLTVTGLRFSPDDGYLISVGRDRHYCLWKRGAETPTEYTLAHNDAKGHSRMILAASWAPQAADKVFATGGRDKIIKIWKFDEGNVCCIQSISTDVPVTALAFLPELVGEHSVLAYGLQNGQLYICRIAVTADYAVINYDQHSALQHSKAVTQLAWRPKHSECQVNGHASSLHQLAIASADSSVHIASLTLD